MKRIMWLSLSIVLISIFASFSLAVLLDPPSFDHHQFEGTVTWDANKLPGPLNVIAKVNSKDVVSHIIYPSTCGTTCIGTYGKDISNILRVQAAVGNPIQFYVDTTSVRSYNYEADGFTVLNLDISTPVVQTPSTQQPPANTNLPPVTNNATSNATNQTCEEDWKCGGWSNCTNGIQYKTCVDFNSCNLSNLEKNTTMSCTVTSTENITCREDWQCGEWGDCISSREQRICQRVDDCDMLVELGEADEVIPQQKPTEVRVCTSSQQLATTPRQPVVQQPAANVQASCSDNLLNQNEEDVDCGGICEPCESSRMFFYLMPVIVLILIGLVVFFVVERSPKLEPEQMQQLYNYFQANIRQGFNKDQITDNLVQSGWKRKAVKKFLKKSNM
ncbi:MAG: hypothetical protein ABIH82_03275 [Candidatus Woesearchaeota archaeon]